LLQIVVLFEHACVYMITFETIKFYKKKINYWHKNQSNKERK